jgi:hypothetical protein
MTIAGVDTISDSKREEISMKAPAARNINPPSLSYFQAIAVMMIRMKLGIR